jgi:hypothetical protein
MQIDMPAHSALCSIFGGFYGYGVVWAGNDLALA